MEAATSSYSVTTDFLQHMYSALVAKNHLKIQSRCLVNEFSFKDIFNNINHGYRAAILKKNSLWLLLFYMAVATYCYYEKAHTTMHTAIVCPYRTSLITWRIVLFNQQTNLSLQVFPRVTSYNLKKRKYFVYKEMHSLSSWIVRNFWNF